MVDNPIPYLWIFMVDKNHPPAESIVLLPPPSHLGKVPRSASRSSDHAVSVVSGAAGSGVWRTKWAPH